MTARLFHLIRDVDVTGVSGTGLVAEGVEYSDGTVSMRWLTDHTSTAIYRSMDDVRVIHGHDGATRVEFGPPLYLALDLWMALDLPAAEFDEYVATTSWADTWATLLDEVRERSGVPRCGEDAGGEPCVLRRHSPSLPHYGRSDVGVSKPLPIPGDAIAVGITDRVSAGDGGRVE